MRPHRCIGTQPQCKNTCMAYALDSEITAVAVGVPLSAPQAVLSPEFYSMRTEWRSIANTVYWVSHFGKKEREIMWSPFTQHSHPFPSQLLSHNLKQLGTELLPQWQCWAIESLLLLCPGKMEIPGCLGICQHDSIAGVTVAFLFLYCPMESVQSSSFSAGRVFQLVL